MKKRQLVVLFIIILTFIASGCSKQNKSEELKIGKYVMQDRYSNIKWYKWLCKGSTIM